jgi:hypothetical protein
VRARDEKAVARHICHPRCYTVNPYVRIGWIGLEALCELYSEVGQAGGRTPVVMDSDDLDRAIRSNDEGLLVGG